jgi:hypothetical protein
MESINLPSEGDVLDHCVIEPPTYRISKGPVVGQESKARRGDVTTAKQEVHEWRETVKGERRSGPE